MSSRALILGLVGATSLALGSCARENGTVTAPTTGAAPTTTAAEVTSPTVASPSTTVAATATSTAPTTEPALTISTTTVPVFTFATAADADGWSVVNDTVMGGVSSGQIAWNGDALVFTGALSLENNGGFASMRSPTVDAARAAEWAGRPSLRVVADADGRAWTVEVRTDDGDGGWIAPLPTTDGVTTDVEMPWSSFEPVTRFLEPRPADVPLDPARIVSIAFYLVDGVEGPFTLALRSVA